MGADRETISAKVPPELRREIRVAAAEADISMSKWIQNAALEKLDGEGREQESPTAD